MKHEWYTSNQRFVVRTTIDEEFDIVYVELDVGHVELSVGVPTAEFVRWASAVLAEIGEALRRNEGE